MDEYPKNMTLIRRYLLGETTEDEREQVERLLLTNQVEFEDALILEDELADDYAQGLLSESERLSFESNYPVTEDRRQKIWFARMLRLHATGTINPVRTPPERYWLRAANWVRGIYNASPRRFAGAYACAFVLMVVLSLFLVQRTAKLKTNLEKEQDRGREISEKSSQLDAQLLAELKTADQLRRRLTEEASHPNSASGRFVVGVSIELTPGISRGAESIPALLVPQDAIIVEIDLKVLHRDYKEFRAELYDSAGREIAMQDRLQTVKGNTGILVPFKYPAEILPSGNYKLQLTAVDGNQKSVVLGNYYFHIDRHS